MSVKVHWKGVEPQQICQFCGVSFEEYIHTWKLKWELHCLQYHTFELFETEQELENTDTDDTR